MMLSKFFRHIGAAFLGLLTPLLLLFVWEAFGNVFIHARHYGEAEFDRKKWLSSDSGSERYRMVKDLQYYYLTDGMQKAEVLQLLGAPSRQTERRMEYEIGSSGMLSCDEALYFLIDENDRITTFGVQ